MKKKLNHEWKAWIHENCHQNICKDTLFKKLIEKQFDVIDIIKNLNYIPNKIEEAINTWADIQNKTTQTESNIKDPLSNTINQIKKMGGEQIENEYFPLFVIDNLIDKDECNDIIDLVNIDTKQATVNDPNDPYRGRKSLTSYPEYLNNDKISELKEKICQTMNISKEHTEGMQGGIYNTNGHFNPHIDATETNKRTWTCLLYLNDVEEGGETRFTKVDISIKPKPGKCIIWYNLNKDFTVNNKTEHTGTLVKSGTKHIITQWFNNISDYT
jgi:prolyl 4-hydroxylase